MWYLARKDSSMRNHHSSCWFEKTSLFKVQNHMLFSPLQLHPFCCLAASERMPLSFIWLKPMVLLMVHHGLFPKSWLCDDVTSQQNCLPMLCQKYSQLMPLSHLPGKSLLSLKTGKGQANKAPSSDPVTCWCPQKLSPASWVRGIMSWTCWIQKNPRFEWQNLHILGCGRPISLFLSMELLRWEKASKTIKSNLQSKCPYIH